MGFIAYGQGYYDGELKAARTFTPRLSIANAVADYIAAFGDMPVTVLDAKGKVVWTGRTRQDVQLGSYKHDSPLIRVQDHCRNCGRKIGHTDKCPHKVRLRGGL